LIMPVAFATRRPFPFRFASYNATSARLCRLSGVSPAENSAMP